MIRKKRVYPDALRDYFSEIAEKYDKIDFLIAPLLRKKAIDCCEFQEGELVLDACTGTGLMAFDLAERGYKVIGVDFSPGMLKVARQKNKSASVLFKEMDAASLEFPENYFSKSFICFGLHEMPPEIREKVLRELKRVTKGEIVILEFGSLQPRFFKKLTAFFLGLFDESPYIKDFIVSNFSRELEAAGLWLQKEIRVLGGFFKIYKCQRR